MIEFIVKYWIEFAFGLAIAGLTACYRHLAKKVKKKNEEYDALKDGIIALLHDRLFQSGMYFLNKGEITVSELDNINDMYEAYHRLGGNGTGTEIYERVKELDIKR